MLNSKVVFLVNVDKSKIFDWFKSLMKSKHTQNDFNIGIKFKPLKYRSYTNMLLISQSENGS